MQKRINKEKDQIKAEMLLKQEIAVEEKISRLVFPILQRQNTIYEAQTILHGLAGYIHHAIENATNKLTVSDLSVDVSKEKEEIGKAINEIYDIVKDQKADLMAKFLKRYGDMLGYYGAQQYLKQPASDLDEDELIVKPKVK